MNYYSKRISLIWHISTDMQKQGLHKDKKVDYAALQKGFFSDFVRSEYAKEIEELEKLDKSVEPTKEELFSYSNYFIKYPDRLAGQLKMSSTYIFPVYSTANLNESVEFLKNQVALLKGKGKSTSAKKPKFEVGQHVQLNEKGLNEHAVYFRTDGNNNFQITDFRGETTVIVFSFMDKLTRYFDVDEIEPLASHKIKWDRNDEENFEENTPITIYYDEYLPKFLSEKFGTMKGYEFIRQIKGDTDFPIKKEVKEYVTPNGRPRTQTEYYFIEFEGRKIILDKYLHDFFAQLRSSYLKENGYRYTQDEFLKMFDNINIVGNPVFYHYESISSAIKNKKDVNADVLKDYPDLMEKQDTSIIDVTDLKSDKIMENKQATQAEKTKALKQHIFEKFKDIVKTSIRYESFSGGTAYRIEYFAKKYNLELERYLQDKLQYFDGVDNFDSQQYRKAEGITHNGVFVNAVKFISVSFTETSQKRKEKKAASKSNSTKSVVSQNTDIQLIDYSDKSIAVVGDTYSIKDKLKNLGGRFNRGLTVNGERTAGWIFKKEQKTELERFVSKSSQSEKPKIDEAKMKRIRINKGKLKLLALKNQSLDGFSGLFGLGSLGKLDKKTISDNEEQLNKLITTDNSSTKKINSFEDNFNRYNKGITENEIKAWVWFKQSQGSPMYGWEKWFLKSTGKNEEVLVTKQATKIKDNHFRDEATVPSGSVLGKPTRFSNKYAKEIYQVYTDKEGNKKFVNKAHTKLQRTSATADKKEIDKLVNEGVLFFGEADLLPLPLFTFGNIYDKILAVESQKDSIISQYGQAVYDNHIEALDAAKPSPLSVITPDASKRLRILPFSEFASQFMIYTDVDGNEIGSEEGISIADFFRIWLSKNEELIETQGISAYNIIDIYLDGGRKSKEEKEFLEKFTRLEGDRLFDIFLHTGLSINDQKRLDMSWNRQFNGFAELNYKRVPIGLKTCALFKGRSLAFLEAQREGVAYIDAVGSGCIAYEVGVGKTITAILIAAQNIQNGTYKRPVIVVPAPTYEKWKNELVGYTDKKENFIEGVLSHLGVKINDYSNLGSPFLKKNKNINKQVEEGSITLLTHEGLEKIGFSPALEEELLTELSKILLVDNGESNRDLESQRESLRMLIGRIGKKTVCDIDILGFDAMIIDEAHNFRNVFSFVPAQEGTKRYNVSGSVAAKAQKAFMLCNYIQRKFGGNVILLTATPFNNSPLEVYSMLSLIALNKMRKVGIDSLSQFMETFIQEIYETVVTSTNKLAQKAIVKSYQNKKSLQALVFNYINLKTGEDAGIRRPKKINLPRLSYKDSDGNIVQLKPSEQITTYLEMNAMQLALQAEAVKLAESGTNFKEKGKNTLIGLMMSRNNAFSPFLVHKEKPVDYIDFVDNSPKIKYTMECIKSVRKHHQDTKTPISGQIIYSNVGKDYFPYIKEYLEKEIGYKTGIKVGRKSFDEVEIITSKVTKNRKEGIKEAFLSGSVKIVIGSGTIREGIDLQKKTTVLYNLYPDYNPTDIKQIEGRFHRQGNENGFVRSVMPLTQNSLDVFVFQKLEEKTARINDVWSKATDDSNVLEQESLNPEAIKFALYTDINKLVDLRVSEIRMDISKSRKKIENELSVLKEVEAAKKIYNSAKTYIHERFVEFKRLATNYIEEYDGSDKEVIMKALEYQKSVLQELNSYSYIDDKHLVRIGIKIQREYKNFFNNNSYGYSDQLGNFRGVLTKINKTESILAKYDNIEDAIKKINEQIIEQDEKLEELGTKEYEAKIYNEIVEEKAKLNIDGRTPEMAAKDFSDLNYLLDYKMADVDGIEGNSLPTDKPKETKLIANKTASNDKAKRIRINKGKLKLMKLKMNELSGIYA
ncbi:SNF2-related protein [Bernardetia sp. OM2101]|uniref:SNF2-related protein n=1 Tax=Bernardetia sp. OM2101 TaxID=3344876 RepID=UPI0035D0251B